MRFLLALCLCCSLAHAAPSMRWKADVVTWYAPAELHKDAAKAFKEWGKIIGVTFSYAETHAEINVSYSELQMEHLGITHKLFEGDRITNATIQINSLYRKQWNADRLDLLTILRHEIGHAIGLGHDDDETSIMYEFAGPRKKISNRDIEAAWTLYGRNFVKRR